MFKLLVKLVLAGLIANATWRLGTAYADYYKFKDSVQQTTQFGPERSEEDLRVRILELAAQYGVPLADDGFTVERSQNHTIVDGGFATPIELFPGYERPWPFSFHIDTFVIARPER
ncbi:MAG: hypothetical protein IT176_04955 [Acidobacteria bacterium]|nr:hypothetical protein [Acidobacteriota bacterium]